MGPKLNLRDKMQSVKLLVAVPISILFICVFIFIIKSGPIRTFSTVPTFDNASLKYHNTLNVDLFPTEKFSTLNTLFFLEPNITLENRILFSERIYNFVRKYKQYQRNDSLNKLTPSTLLNNFPPAFNCPHILERVGAPAGQGKWVCGLEIYEAIPRPQECVIYMINDLGGSSDQTVLEELSRKTDCHLLYFNFENKTATRTDDLGVKFRLFRRIKLGSAVVNETKTLRQLMRTNGHAWIDILFLDIGGREFPVLKQIIADFYEIIPVGQLNLVFQVSKTNEHNKEYIRSFKTFLNWFEALERKGLRPFHSDVDMVNEKNSCTENISVSYAFMNIRGKHLLLRGK